MDVLPNQRLKTVLMFQVVLLNLITATYVILIKQMTVYRTVQEYGMGIPILMNVVYVGVMVQPVLFVLIVVTLRFVAVMAIVTNP